MSSRSRRAEHLTKREYEVLADFRYALRKFLGFSEEAAAAVGLHTQQYQALLAIKGSRDHEYLSVGEMAERLNIRHHTAVQLVDRLELRELVRRKTDSNDARRVHVHLTRKGERVLETLASAHVKELQTLRPALEGLISGLEGQDH